jgi:hypothetical protein
MQQLMEEGDYFSASSLESRAPSIYHEYVGEGGAPSLPRRHTREREPVCPGISSC